MNVAFSADPLEIVGTPSGPPAAPDLVQTYPGSDSALDVYWRDNAIDEQFYEVTIDIGAFGYTSYRMNSGSQHYRIDNLTPNRAYRVQVCAWNQHGASCSDWLRSDVLPNSQPPDPEYNWVRVIDSNVSIDGSPSNNPVPPLDATPSGNLFEAVQVQAYWDTNGNGLVDDHPFPTVLSGATFTLETRAQPADSQGQTYNTVYGVDYACHSGLNKCANLIVIMVIEPTGGQASPDTNVYLAMHYHYEENSNMFLLFDVRGGDWAAGAGKTMIWAGNLPNGFPPPTISSLQIPAPRSSNGYVAGTLQVPLVFIETFSYFDSSGSPAVGTITYQSVVEAEFGVSLRSN